MKDSILAVQAIALCAALALCAAFPLRAGADEVRVVDLQECIRLGLASDAGLRVDVMEAGIADARLRELQGQYFPSVMLLGGYSRLSDVAPGSMSVDLGPAGQHTITFPSSLDNATSVRLSVQQPLFTGLRIASSIRQAEALRGGSNGDAEAARLELRYTIAEAFWNVARSRTQVATFAQGAAQARVHLDDATKLLDQGMATNNDVLQARMRQADAQIELAGAETALDIARVGLALLIGLPWSGSIDIPDTPAVNVAPPGESIQELVTLALSNRPEIQAARFRVAAQEASVDAAHAGLFPSVFLTGDYTLADPNQRVFPQVDQFTGTWSVGVMASIDIGRYPQVLAQEDQARNRLGQAREGTRKIADAVTADVVRAFLTLTEAIGRLAALHEETAQAEENDRVTQERYRQGVALSSESLDAQTMVMRARLRESATLFDCQVARAALDKAVGR
jgi:outer membrane protein